MRLQTEPLFEFLGTVRPASAFFLLNDVFFFSDPDASDFICFSLSFQKSLLQVFWQGSY